MATRITIHQLQSLVASHADLDHVSGVIWAAWDADEIGSAACRQLLGKVRDRRVAMAEERRRLAVEFDRTVPAAEGLEAPEDHGDAWEGGTDGG
jgi:glyoxylase-like metal-dependent hydrolase (beta-lactamase superfamily II)